MSLSCRDKYTRPVFPLIGTVWERCTVGNRTAPLSGNAAVAANTCRLLFYWVHLTVGKKGQGFVVMSMWGSVGGCKSYSSSPKSRMWAMVLP